MKKGILLQERQTGLLWLETNTYHCSIYISTPNGIVDFTKCKEIEAKFVSRTNLGTRLASPELLVFENKGLFTLMTPYLDNCEFGATYVSVLPGFSCKSISGFSYNNEIYIVAKNIENKWGCIRISTKKPEVWPYNSFSSIEIVPFEQENFEAALLQSGVTIAPYTTQWGFKHQYESGDTTTEISIIGDLTKHNNYSNEECDTIGKTIKEMLSTRDMSDTIDLPNTIKELYDQMEKKFIFHNMNDRDIFCDHMIITVWENWLYSKTSSARIALLLNMTDPAIIGNKKLFAMYILSRYMRHLTSRD